MIKNTYYYLKSKTGAMISGDYYLHKNPKSDKVFLIFPGMMSHTEQYMYLRTRDLMVEKGYDVLVIDAYSSCKVGDCYPRSTLEVTMQNHIDDFNDIILDMKSKYSKIYAAGHSIGGRVLISANNINLLGQALLDPSGDFSNDDYKKLTEEGFKCSDEWKCDYIDWNDGIFIPVGNIHNELKDRPFSEVADEVKFLSVPTLFIAAGRFDYAKVYEKHLNSICKYAVIEGACHEFTEYGIVDEMVAEISNFFNSLEE